MELSEGFHRLHRYLSAWAAFEAWLADTGR